jgi:hypothetical protein
MADLSLKTARSYVVFLGTLAAPSADEGCALVRKLYTYFEVGVPILERMELENRLIAIR